MSELPTSKQRVWLPEVRYVTLCQYCGDTADKHTGTFMKCPENKPVAAAPQAPIAKITVKEGPAHYAPDDVYVSLYAPGLPPGEHDVYLNPEAPGTHSDEIARLRAALQIEERSTSEVLRERDALQLRADETDGRESALQRVIDRHVRWRETALGFLRQVVDGRGSEDEWPALAEFLERSDSRMAESSAEKRAACDGCGMPATARCPHCQAVTCGKCAVCEHSPEEPKSPRTYTALSYVGDGPLPDCDECHKPYSAHGEMDECPSENGTGDT